jgi:hypothetical protein
MVSVPPGFEAFHTNQPSLLNIEASSFLSSPMPQQLSHTMDVSSQQEKEYSSEHLDQIFSSIEPLDSGNYM